ncbi:MAG TPA: hypothetical protein VGA69_05425 [Nitriliruptorales bacterium]
MLTAVLVLGACSDSGQPVPLDQVRSPTPSEAASPSGTPVGQDDPYAIPEQITAGYVETVYAALAKLEAEAIQAYRTHVESGGDPTLPPKEAVDRFQAIYSERYFPGQMVVWQELAESGFEGIRADLGQVYISVDELVHAAAACVLVVARHDLSGMATSPGDDLPSYVALVPSKNSASANPTPWEIQFEYLTSGSTPSEASPCGR